jgi:dolichol-phosphate mannosyltransferase
LPAQFGRENAQLARVLASSETALSFSESLSMTTVSPEKFALVVPTLNEAGNIERLLGKVHDVLDPLRISYEVLVVDDGSTDGTRDRVRLCGDAAGRVRLICREGQRGLAGAVVHGWQQSDAELLGVMDADLQHPPELLAALLEVMGEGHDLAIGSRYASGNGVEGWNPIRVAISRVSTWATLPLQRKGVRVTDPMSGFFIVRRASIEGLSFETKGFKLLLEILVRARIRSAREVPFHFGRRQVGKSKAGFAVAVHYLQLLGKLSRELILKPSPQ